MYPIVALGLFAGLTIAASDPQEAHRTPPVPALMAEWGSSSEPLRIRTAAVDIRIVGHLAETRTTMTFHNPRPRPLSGDFYFPLSEGSTLSGYALEVDGRMVDAVVVEKRDAPQVFERNVEKDVDIGTIEPTKDNRFITRVSPIPAGGTRTIMVRFVTNLIDTAEDGSVYRLPFGFRDRIEELSLRVEIVRATERPRIVEAAGLVDFRFTDRGDSFVAERIFSKPALSGDLRIALPDLPNRAVRVETAFDDQTYFLIRDPVAAPPTEPTRSKMKRIRVLWDTSGSRTDSDIEREIALLESYLASAAAVGATIELQLFSLGAAKIQRFQLPAQLDALLNAVRSVRYDGGTQIGSLGNLSGDAQPDAYLLFSDGTHTLGNDDPSGLNAPVYAISSSPSTNPALLERMARKTGGAYFDLNRSSDAEVIAAIGQTEFRFLSAAISEGAVGDTYPSLRSPVRAPFVFVGKLLGDAAAITLEYGIDGRVLERRRFEVRREDAVKGDLIARHWASTKLAELRAFPGRKREEIVALGKHYSIVTPETALVVLEQLEDYVEHRTRPPATLPEMEEQYDSQIEQLESGKRKRGGSKSERMVALWEEQATWWKTVFRYPRRFRYQPLEQNGISEERNVSAEPDPTSVEIGSVRTFSEEIVFGLGNLDLAVLDPISPNLEMKARIKTLGPAIRFESWNPDTLYLKALEAAPRARRFDLYLEQKKTARSLAGILSGLCGLLQPAGRAAARIAGAQQRCRTRTRRSVFDPGARPPLVAAESARSSRSAVRTADPTPPGRAPIVPRPGTGACPASRTDSW